jgi:hypothetical protein
VAMFVRVFGGANLGPGPSSVPTQPLGNDYSRAPEEATITVLTLEHGEYVDHEVFRRGETATSALLSGFTVSVDAVCDAA